MSYLFACVLTVFLALREGQLDRGHISMSSLHPAVMGLYHVHSYHISVRAGPVHPLRLNAGLAREGGAVGHMVQSDYDVLIKRPASEEGGSEGERWTIG